MEEREKPCRHCRGSGIDRNSHQRDTSGGRDDRSCPECNGEGIRQFEGCAGHNHTIDEYASVSITDYPSNHPAVRKLLVKRRS